MDGKGRCAINAKYILDVGMATVMEALGNVFATLTGVAFFVIKVSVSIAITSKLHTHTLIPIVRI